MAVRIRRMSEDPKSEPLFASTPQYDPWQPEPAGQGLAKTLGSSGIHFKDATILGQAVTKLTWDKESRIEINPPMETLGDKVLWAALALDVLQQYPTCDANDLNDVRMQYLSNSYLAKVADRLNLPSILDGKHIGSRDYSASGTKKRANLVEAVVGALYLDQGLPGIKAFLETIQVLPVPLIPKKPVEDVDLPDDLQFDVALAKLEGKAGVYFKDRSHLRQALTSWRHVIKGGAEVSVANNSGLESLGDSMIALALADHFIHKGALKHRENITPAIASASNNRQLAKVAVSLEMQSCLRITTEGLYATRTKNKPGERSPYKAFANALEAFVGAVFLEGGKDAAFGFCEKHIIPHARDAYASRHSWEDGKMWEEWGFSGPAIPRMPFIDKNKV